MFKYFVEAKRKKNVVLYFEATLGIRVIVIWHVSAERGNSELAIEISDIFVSYLDQCNCLAFLDVEMSKN